jgi:membrane protein YqaA with SNARE-associated domain
VPTIDPQSPILALLTAFATGFAVGILPVGLAEVAAVAIGVVQPPKLALAMLVAFTVAHVAAKLPWYLLGMLADRSTHPRAQAFTARARDVVARYPGFGLGVLASSAVTSVPPFHLAAIASGIVRIPFMRFVIICLAGRAVRFGLLAAVPSLLRAWLG